MDKMMACNILSHQGKWDVNSFAHVLHLTSLTLLSVNLGHLRKSHVIADSNSYFTESCRQIN